MRTIIVYLVVSLFTFSMANAQEDDFLKSEKEEKIEELEEKKEEIIEQEKELLKEEVEEINNRLAEGKITLEKADNLKKELAEKHALNIDNKIAIIDNKIALVSRNESDAIDDKYEDNWSVRIGESRKSKMEFRDERRTYSEVVVAFGLNNALEEGQSLSDSEFKIGGSRFFEIGMAWKTRVFQNSNWVRFKYGFSFQFNGLKPTDNRYFVEDGELTVLEEFPLDLKKSKFRVDNLVFPVHFEFGPSKKVETENSVRFYTYDKLKFGLGGYAGFNLGERQKLKYKEDGDKVKEKLKNNYNTSDFVYGLSGYVGVNSMALYAKYDLSPLFTDNPVDQHNFSLGLRFDLD